MLAAVLAKSPTKMSSVSAASDELRKLRDDFRGASLFRVLSQPGYWGVVNHRIAAALVRARLFKPLYYVYAPVWRAITLITGIEISPRATIGAGLRIMHHGQIFVNSGTTIGRNGFLYNNVTIGISGFEGNAGPTIGDNLRVGVGSRILGPITLGDDCTVGANSVVTRSYGSHVVLVGAPAKPVERDIGNATSSSAP